MDEKEALLAEWKEIRETLRYFGNKRFAQLTVFIAVTGFLVKACSDINSREWMFSLLGFIICIVFLIMERRSVEYIDAFVDRGKVIEPILKIELIRSRPQKNGLDRWLTGTSATYVFYGSISIYWLALLIFCACGKVAP